MKYTILAVLLACLCVPAKADSITNLSGQLFLPGESLTYNFQIHTIFRTEFGGFVEDIFSGTSTVTTADGATGTSNFGGDIFEFQLNERMILFQFAIAINTGDPYTVPILTEGYNFVASADGVSIVHFVPEPSVLALALVGLALCCFLAIPRRLH
jgi:hypothetical protein